MDGSRRVSVVIVNRNTRELLRECLHALASQQQPPLVDVIVVDNGSTDGSTEMIRTDFSNVLIIQNAENLGYAHANNQGIRASAGDTILLMNSDAVLSRHALRDLVDFTEATPSAGVVGVKLLNSDGSLQRLSRGRALSAGSAVNQFLLLSNAFPRSRGLRGFHIEGDFHSPDPVDWVSTACALFRRAALADVGDMDEDLVTYGTDIDLCQRIRKAGWLVYSLPTEVTHHGGASFPDAARSSVWYRSIRKLYAKDHGRLSMAFFDLLAAIGFAMRAALHVSASITRNDPDRRARALTAWTTSKTAARILLTGRDHALDDG